MSGILLVTEDRELGNRIRDTLRDTKAKLIGVCGTFRTAVDVFQKTHPNMVVLETFLPESSGLEALKNFKQMNEHCVFVMLSRLRTRSALERAFRLGAHDVLLFPVDMEILRQTILHRLKTQISQRMEDGI